MVFLPWRNISLGDINEWRAEIAKDSISFSYMHYSALSEEKISFEEYYKLATSHLKSSCHEASKNISEELQYALMSNAYNENKNEPNRYIMNLIAYGFDNKKLKSAMVFYDEKNKGND